MEPPAFVSVGLMQFNHTNAGLLLIINHRPSLRQFINEHLANFKKDVMEKLEKHK